MRLRFNHKGQRFEKNKSYGNIRYNKAKEELETWFSQQVKTLIQQPVEPIEEDDDGNIWITLFLNTSF